MTMYPLLFQPNLQERVWGGTRLKDLKGMPHDERPIGESWEISDVPGCESIIRNGEYRGMTLGKLTRHVGAELVGKHIFDKYGTEFPLLVKFIDAAHDLSIQVHPNDALAHARHGKLGKTEMWYVMQADPGATLLAGFREQITPEEYEQRVEDGSIINVLARHEVHTGDVFFIPAGRVHSICGGIMLCEIQQSSDITYRLYDYHRLGLDGKPRELHTLLAKEAIDFHVYPRYRAMYQPVSEGAVCVTDCPYFTVNVITTSHTLTRQMQCADSFITLSCLSGTALITDSEQHCITLPVGTSCLIPAAVANYAVVSLDNSQVRLLEAYAK